MRQFDTARQIPTSITIVDLNGLKPLNDTYGHRQGDRMLRDVSRLLHRCSREGIWSVDGEVMSPSSCREWQGTK